MFEFIKKKLETLYNVYPEPAPMGNPPSIPPVDSMPEPVEEVRRTEPLEIVFTKPPESTPEPPRRPLSTNLDLIHSGD